MTGLASIVWRRRAKAAALLLPLLVLPACSSGDQAMADKLAAAEAAADKAVAAQKAAERAAAIATSSRPAPVAEIQQPSIDGTSLDNDDAGGGDAPEAPPPAMGGPGQTVAADGTVIPG